MSESRTFWISTTSSGLRKNREPSRCDLKCTPSSATRALAFREKIWKPPLSVRIGLSQAMKRCSEANFFMTSVPGRRNRW